MGGARASRGSTPNWISKGAHRLTEELWRSYEELEPTRLTGGMERAGLSRRLKRLESTDQQSRQARAVPLGSPSALVCLGFFFLVFFFPWGSLDSQIRRFAICFYLIGLDGDYVTQGHIADGR